MEQKRRSRPPKAAPARAAQTDVGQEIIGVVLAAVGVWFLLALAGMGGGELGNLLSRGLSTSAGHFGAWLLSLCFVWLGCYLVYLRFHKRPFEWGRRAWGLVLLLGGLLVVAQLVRYPDDLAGGDLENARLGYGGGMIGWALAVPLTRIFGPAGRYVALVAALLVGLVLNTEITLGGVVHWIKEKLFAGARGTAGAAGDFYKLMASKPTPRHGAEEAEEDSRPRRRKQAATEDLNTIGGRAKQSADSETGLIKLNPGPDGKAAAGAMATAEPLIRKSEPVLHAGTPPLPVDGAADMAARASRSVQAAAEKQKQNEELPAGKLVTHTGGGPDPDKLANAYQLPPISMLAKPQPKPGASKADHLERAGLLERTLKTFGVEARVIEISPGPAVTRYELQPAAGVRVNKFTQLADDLALALAAEDIRIEAPIPGKAAVGIEVPNKERQTVPLREVMETPAFLNSASKLSVAFGKDNAGNPVVGDLSKMPHLLIAGSTGSGKSVCMNTIICSLLFKARPDEVKMLMVDPKMVELSTYNGIPHLMAPVITDTKKAAGYLKGAVKEMENRYELFAAAGARNLAQYNQMCLDDPGPDPEHPRKPLPFIVIFVDELADLMMVAPVDVEDSICRLAQMARACGMHLVIATQSPRVDVITGLIKANVPSRIAFAVSSQIDSRVIMDYAGAERLLGRGDMLYHANGLSKAMRAQGAFIDDKAVEDLVAFVKAQGRPVYTAEEVAVEVGGKRGGGAVAGEGEPSSAADAVFPQAVRVVVEHGQASVSILQRRLRCNYNKAARLIDMMEERGFIGPHQGSKPRDVLLSLPQWQEMFGDSEADAVDEAQA